MAKAPEFQQSLSQASPTTYIQQGIVDKSEAMRTAADFNLGIGLAKTGIDAYKAYEEQTVLSDVTEQVNQLEKERYERSLEGIQALEEGLASNQQQRDLIKKQAGYDETYPIMLNTDLNENVKGITASIDEQSTRLLKAKEQGRMTQDELEARLKKIAREALAKNPAYTKEISAHVANVSDLMNMTAKVKIEDKLFKDQRDAYEAQIKQLTDTAIALGISPWDPRFQTNGQLDPNKLAPVVNNRMELKDRKIMMDNIVSANEDIAKINAETYAQSGDYVRDQIAIINDFDDRAIEILQSDANNKEQLLVQLEKDVMQGMATLLSKLKLSENTPSIKTGADFVRQSITDLKTTYTRYATGKAPLEQLENTIKANRAAAEIAIENQFRIQGKNYWKWRNSIDILKDFPQLLQSDYTKLFFEDFNITSKYTLGTEDDNGVSTRLGVKRKELNNRSSIEVYTNKAIESAKNDSTQIPNISEAIDMHNRILSNESLSQSEGVQATRELILSLQDPFVKASILSLDPNVMAKANENISDYTQVLENATSSFKSANPNVELQIQRREDGTIQVKGIPIDSTYNRAIKQINETFKAFYHTSGMSLDDAVNDFYSRIPSLGLGVTEKK